MKELQTITRVRQPIWGKAASPISRKGALTEGSLLQLIGSDVVQRTTRAERLPLGERLKFIRYIEFGWISCTTMIKMTEFQHGLRSMNRRTERKRFLCWIQKPITK